MKERNLSLELVKLLAVITVANHWMEPLYVKWGALATGGAIGDVLFFFVSGYTLFLGRFGRFDNWYKRRVKRIYPSLLSNAIILSFLDIEQLTLKQIVLGGGYWFLSCIMLYYFLLYFVRKFAENKPLIPFLITIAVVVVWYCQWDSSSMFIFSTVFRWSFMFLFMLMGAYLGNKTIELRSRPILDVLVLLFSLILFYGIQYFALRHEFIAHLQILILLPLMGIVISIYKLCCANGVERLMKSKFGLCLRFVAGLCLEVYLVSDVVINMMIGKMYEVFPLNLLVTFVLILFVAYFTRCLARVLSQIFEKEDMNWKSVFKAIH